MIINKYNRWNLSSNKFNKVYKYGGSQTPSYSSFDCPLLYRSSFNFHSQHTYSSLASTAPTSHLVSCLVFKSLYFFQQVVSRDQLFLIDKHSIALCIWNCVVAWVASSWAYLICSLSAIRQFLLLSLMLAFEFHNFPLILIYFAFAHCSLSYCFALTVIVTLIWLILVLFVWGFFQITY